MKISHSRYLKLAYLGGASLFLTQVLQAATIVVPNGGFDTTAGWTGSFRAGDQGGFGWDASYFGGSYPTDNTFATTLGGQLSQTLSGVDSTFIEGTTYTLSMSIFGSSNYATGANIMWSLGFAADGAQVASDHWFSDEFTASTVSANNGGTIPVDHITTVGGSTGLKTVTLSYTATAADNGKAIGILLAGNTQSKYTLASGAPAPDSYYGMMDNVTLTSVAAVPEPSTVALVGTTGAIGLMLRRRCRRLQTKA